MSTPPPPPSTRRAWIGMVAAPFVLGLAFVPVAVYLARSRALEGDALLRAMEPIAWMPGLVGFGGLLALTWWLARADGLGWADLGWARPRWTDLGLGLGVGLALLAVNVAWVHPWIMSLRPSFDPTLASMGWAEAVLLVGVGAVAEDTLFRGHAWTMLRRRFGPVHAAVWTSVFYAILAPGQGWPLILWAFALGLVLAGLRQWRGSLWSVVLVHLCLGLGPKAWVGLWG